MLVLPMMTLASAGHLETSSGLALITRFQHEHANRAPVHEQRYEDGRQRWWRRLLETCVRTSAT